MTRPAAEWFKQKNVLREDVRRANDGRPLRPRSSRPQRRADGSEADTGDTPAADLWAGFLYEGLEPHVDQRDEVRGAMVHATEADQSYVFELPWPVFREFAFRVYQFELAGDGSWRARRMIECIREIWVKHQAGDMTAEHVFYRIFVELTEGLDCVLTSVTLICMSVFAAVPPGDDAFAAEAMVDRFNTIAEWLDAIKTQAAESETSCKLVAVELLGRGSPFTPLQMSEESDEDGEDK